MLVVLDAAVAVAAGVAVGAGGAGGAGRSAGAEVGVAAAGPAHYSHRHQQIESEGLDSVFELARRKLQAELGKTSET